MVSVCDQAPCHISMCHTSQDKNLIAVINYIPRRAPAVTTEAVTALFEGRRVSLTLSCNPRHISRMQISLTSSQMAFLRVHTLAVSEEESRALPPAAQFSIVPISGQHVVFLNVCRFLYRWNIPVPARSLLAGKAATAPPHYATRQSRPAIATLGRQLRFYVFRQSLAYVGARQPKPAFSVCQ